jgi:hypothetical protein
MPHTAAPVKTVLPCGGRLMLTGCPIRFPLLSNQPRFREAVIVSRFTIVIVELYPPPTTYCGE